MRYLLKTLREWFNREPPKQPNPTDKFDPMIRELREENRKMTAQIERLEPADVLRALVINMNSSKNR